jgi:hypothetical protein
MTSYPKVRDEFETLDMVLAGYSCARIGDGEAKIAMGGSSVSQIYDPKLAAEMRSVLHSKSKECIVCIPRMVKDSAKYGSWKKYERVYPRLLKDGKTYYSAFITRTDSAPWCDTPEYFDKIESLWRDQDIVAVYGTERSLSATMMHSAKSVTVVSCSRRDAYAEIDRVEREVLASGRKRAILCAGAMATVLAMRLSTKGIHALDLGHIGFMPRARQWKGAENE